MNCSLHFFYCISFHFYIFIVTIKDTKIQFLLSDVLSLVRETKITHSYQGSKLHLLPELLLFTNILPGITDMCFEE